MGLPEAVNLKARRGSRTAYIDEGPGIPRIENAVVLETQNVSVTAMGL